MDLVGITEIAELRGVSRQRANRIANHAGFPAPAAKPRLGRVWERGVVLAHFGGPAAAVRSLDLVGVAEIADMAGVSKQRAKQIADQAAFPAPAGALRAGPVWKREDVASYLQATRPEDANAA